MDTYNIVKLRFLKHNIHKLIKVNGWDAKEVVTLVNLSDFEYLWFEEKASEEFEPSGATVLSVHKTILNTSPFYYINSYTETLEDLRKKNSRNDYNLIETMENMNWNTVVKNIDPNSTNVYEFRNEDFLIDLEGNVV